MPSSRPLPPAAGPRPPRRPPPNPARAAQPRAAPRGAQTRRPGPRAFPARDSRRRGYRAWPCSRLAVSLAAVPAAARAAIPMGTGPRPRLAWAGPPRPGGGEGPWWAALGARHPRVSPAGGGDLQDCGLQQVVKNAARAESAGRRLRREHPSRHPPCGLNFTGRAGPARSENRLLPPYWVTLLGYKRLEDSFCVCPDQYCSIPPTSDE